MVLRVLMGMLAAVGPSRLAAAAGDGSRMCAGCHRDVWESYRRTGMGRSFYRPSPERMIEDFTGNHTFYHRSSDRYYRMLRRGGEYFQQRYQLDAAGRRINVMEKRIDYVMGSGNHARAYLHRTASNTLVELPLAWYAEKGGYWAMNPGYDRPHHDGFRRPIPYDCMFCHNAYPEIPPGNERAFAPPVYSGELGEGIDCQRCHGPGGRHARLAATPGAKREEVREAILNPARLSPRRQMELCMQCHLETTSFPLPNAIRPYERGPFSYRPGEPLGGFILNLDHAPGSGREDKFEIAGAAYRLRRSACFRKSNGRLLCTTCHDPHDIPRGEAAKRHYNEVCRNCHGAAMERLVRAGHHPRGDGCIDCHMPKRRTEDVVHAVVTDHSIQRREPAGDPLAERAERQETYRGPVVLYYPETIASTPENELLVAIAQVQQGSNREAGIQQLTAAIARYSPRRPEYYLELARALENNGELAKAVPVYREAARRDPQWAPGVEQLGGALRRAGDFREAAAVLQRAASLAPGEAAAWHELGMAYRALGRRADAAAAWSRAIELDPDFPEAYNNLGILKASAGEREGAEATFREAIRIRPDYADAHGNLANLLAAAGNLAEARDHFEIALRLQPGDAAVHYNFAMLLGRSGRIEEAQRELEASVRADPGFADAQERLGELLLAKGLPRDAIPHYRAALRVKPESGRAHLGLGQALAAAGDLAEATAHLRQAAAGADPRARAQAGETLRRLGQKP